MNETASKTCLTCYMHVPEIAKRCPFCNEKIGNKPPVIIHPAIGLVFAVMFILSVLGTSFWAYFKITPSAEDFSDYKALVTTQVTKMDFRVDARGEELLRHKVVVFGEINNTSPIHWKSLALELRVFNKNGELIDVDYSRNRSLSVAANNQREITISTELDFPKSEYHSAKILIVDANEKKSL